MLNFGQLLQAPDRLILFLLGHEAVMFFEVFLPL